MLLIAWLWLGGASSSQAVSPLPLGSHEVEVAEPLVRPPSVPILQQLDPDVVPSTKRELRQPAAARDRVEISVDAVWVGEVHGLQCVLLDGRGRIEALGTFGDGQQLVLTVPRGRAKTLAVVKSTLPAGASLGRQGARATLLHGGQLAVEAIRLGESRIHRARLNLTRLATLDLSVLDAAGAALPSTDLTLVPIEPQGPSETARADELGQARFDSIEPGAYLVRARAALQGQALPLLEYQARPGACDVMVLQARTGVRSLRGRVEDQEGRPVSRLFVGAFRDGYRMKNGRTAYDGSFEIPDVLLASGELVITKDRGLVEDLRGSYLYRVLSPVHQPVAWGDDPVLDVGVIRVEIDREELVHVRCDQPLPKPGARAADQPPLTLYVTKQRAGKLTAEDVREHCLWVAAQQADFFTAYVPETDVPLEASIWNGNECIGRAPLPGSGVQELMVPLR